VEVDDADLALALLYSNLLYIPNVAAHGILNCTEETTEPEIASLHVAQRCELFLETYRRPDGSRWTGQQLDEATGGVVSRSYVTNLRKGRIDNPGYEKMRAIAKAMGFAPEAWFEENVSGGTPSGLADESSGVSGRLEHLLETVRNPKTGEPYTNAEVARMTLGDLSEEDV
jgi:transcriptional regulator with XRE-family HTH domain